MLIAGITHLLKLTLEVRFLWFLLSLETKQPLVIIREVFKVGFMKLPSSGF